jgi:hypothetical protein
MDSSITRKRSLRPGDGGGEFDLDQRLRPEEAGRIGSFVSPVA